MKKNSGPPCAAYFCTANLVKFISNHKDHRANAMSAINITCDRGLRN